MKTLELLAMVVVLLTALALSSCAAEKQFCSEHYDYNGNFYNRTCRGGKS